MLLSLMEYPHSGPTSASSLPSPPPSSVNVVVGVTSVRHLWTCLSAACRAARRGLSQDTRRQINERTGRGRRGQLAGHDQDRRWPRVELGRLSRRPSPILHDDMLCLARSPSPPNCDWRPLKEFYTRLGWGTPNAEIHSERVCINVDNAGSKFQKKM